MCDKDQVTQQQETERRSDVELEDLQRQIDALQAQIDIVQVSLDKILAAIVGNGGVSTLDKLTSLIEKLGVLFETLHYQSQQKTEVLEKISDQVGLDKSWREVARMWQALVVAQAIAAQEL